MCEDRSLPGDEDSGHDVVSQTVQGMDAQAGLSGALPHGLPPAVADLFRRRGIVARGQAAAAIACLIISEELRRAEDQNEADLRAALALIGVDAETALGDLVARFPAPPPGVPLDEPGEAAPPAPLIPALTPAPPGCAPETEAGHG